MNWYYAENGQQRGPVSEAELSALFQAGQITNSTLVWNQTLANWQPYAQSGAPGSALAPSGAPTPGPADTASIVCVECGKVISSDEAIRLADAWVCGACKPVFVQRLSEGAALPRLGPCSEEELLERDYDAQVGPCLSRGWNSYVSSFGPFLGTSLLLGFLILVVNFFHAVVVGLATATGLSVLVAQIVGQGLHLILWVLFTGALSGGLWTYFVRKTRREEATLQDAFSGFGRMFGQLLLANLVATILSVLPLIPGYALLIVGILSAAAAPGPTAAAAIFPLAGGALIIVGFLGYIGLATLWLFSIPLVADKRLPFWPAMQLSRKMVSKHFWSNLGLLVVLGIIIALPVVVVMMVGLGVVGISAGSGTANPQGILMVTGLTVIAGLIWMGLCGPFFLGSLSHRYNDIFAELAPRT
jgi:hypothetical protein